MLRYLAGRLLAAVPTLVALTLVAFTLTTAARGDSALLALQQAGQDPTPDTLAEYRHQLGLDQPFPIRYARWLASAIQGDLGRSFLSLRPVAAILAERIPATLLLGASALALSTLLGVVLGVVFALRHDTPFDRAGRAATLVLASVPSFWLSIGLIVLFGERLRLLPVAGYGTGLHLAMPSLALALGPAASLMRLTRARMLEALSQDYVRTARAKGLAESTVVNKHALRNALIPLVTIVALSISGLFAGAPITETVFAWPGVGRLLVESVLGGDYVVAQAVLMFLAALVLIFNLVADVGYALLDPRIRYD